MTTIYCPSHFCSPANKKCLFHKQSKQITNFKHVIGEIRYSGENRNNEVSGKYTLLPFTIISI